jgi:hypothetical protein
MNIRKPYNNTQKFVTLGSIWLLGGEVVEKNAVGTESAKVAIEYTYC